MRVLSNLLVICARLPDYLLLRAFTHALRILNKDLYSATAARKGRSHHDVRQSSCTDNYMKVCKQIASKIFIIILSVSKRTLHQLTEEE